jgi:L-seryl-tRNA(Ser) seleniumtransferase
MSRAMQDPRRALPSVNALLESGALDALLAHTPRALVTDVVRNVLDDARRALSPPQRSLEEWAALVDTALQQRVRPSLRPVLNATGVVLHTNLGRAPLPRAALHAIASVAGGYANLEYDLDTGARGSRYAHCVALLCELTGAEHALVVNNCAAALVLALNTLAHDREAVVSRGELVEIGGSFRVPDIMARSGARLVEVGTTNRTTIADYRDALTDRTGALVKVHRSNFVVEGFVSEASLEELVALGSRHELPVVKDFGSGLLLALARFGLTGERTAPELVATGVSAIVMSGDKLLGGPQAGIVLGRREVVERMARNPLTRALRVDKLTLAALEATLSLYRDPEHALQEIPVLRMLTTPDHAIRARAESLVASLGETARTVRAEPSVASVGGGAFPTARIPSWAVTVTGDATSLEALLRNGETPLISRVQESRVWIDLRTIDPGDDALVERALRLALGRG